MTAATRTRPARTPKTTTKGKTKKPKWEVITFKKIEEWREKLGLTKSGMAEALGVTNSTFHNWRRGTTVPHPNQQQEIAERIAVLEKNAGTGNGTVSKPAKVSKQGDTKTKAAKSSKSKPTKAKPAKGPGTARKQGAANKTRTRAGQAKQTPVTHPANGNLDSGAGVAMVTAAWLTNQQEPVSAASVVDFIREVGQVL